VWTVRTSQETQIHCVGSLYLTGDTNTLWGQSVPHRRHRYTVGAVCTSQETQIHCGGSMYLTGDTDTLWGQFVPHRRHRYTVGAVCTSQETQIHCGGSLYLTGDTDTLWGQNAVLNAKAGGTNSYSYAFKWLNVVTI
jgi:hypothetical protein